MELIILLTLVVLGYIVGSITESKHYKSIKAREKLLLNLPAVTIKDALEKNREIEKSELVVGSVVISLDYFKRFLAGLRNFVGGEISSYETLIDRARREAILRMKESTKGANIILNLRIETSAIGKTANNRKSVGSIEAIAYGTAITYK